jgi:excisionase family DNA binding protein
MNPTASVPPVVLQPELYRIREAAAVLAVSPRMIYTLLERGDLTPVKLPGLGTRRAPVRIARADVLAFVARLRGATA